MFPGAEGRLHDVEEHSQAFVDENKLYDDAVKTRAEWDIDIPLLNDHDIGISSSANPLIIVEPKPQVREKDEVLANTSKDGEALDSTDDELNLLGTPTKRPSPARLATCGYCKALGQTFRDRDKEKLEAHLLAKHGMTSNSVG